MLGQIQIREEIAERLKQARENAGFATIESFCESTGLSIEEYTDHEAGRIPLKASQAMQYCRLLHITLHWLMIGEDNLKPAVRQRRKTPALNATKRDLNSGLCQGRIIAMPELA